MDNSSGAEQQSHALLARVKQTVSAFWEFSDAGGGTEATARNAISNVPPDAGVSDGAGFYSPQFTAETGLTPREYVLLFLEANGGRARQQALIESLQWSDSTVCRLLRSLEEAGEIQSTQTGRENVVLLPDAGPQ